MQKMEWLLGKIAELNPKLVVWIEKTLRNIPAVHREIEREYDKLMEDVESSLKPYRGEFPSYLQIPPAGVEREKILSLMVAIKDLEEARWRDGFASGAVYHGQKDHIEFLNKIYATYSQANPLHADLWPSISKYEAEIVSMTANMLGAKDAEQLDSTQDNICGTVTSGGTESILLAMKTYRDWARAEKGVKNPEMILPVTAHAAFDKAAQFFNIKAVRVPINGEYKADIGAVERSISRNTIVIVGSAPSYPHGIVDPIEEMSELAKARGVGFHTDSCLGGFLLPWAERLGYPVPPFDFRLPGVTSISADTHKYGYAAKGTSVILYRSEDLRRYQYYTVADWPGGLYFSPTFAGSRPGALSAACWASMVVMGESGYLEATQRILESAAKIRAGIETFPELYVLGDPLWVIAFDAHDLDIYRIMEGMAKRKWSLNGLHKPRCIHLCVTLTHTQPGVGERFIADLKDVIEEVKGNPDEAGEMAPIYGMAATTPLQGLVTEMLKRYIDLIYKV
jgi:glutamate/tyrosine decarboxylase-like PLP-dependent enzyme